MSDSSKGGRPAQHPAGLLKITAYLAPEVVEELRRLSAATLVPQAALVRRAVDDLLAAARRPLGR